MIFTLYNYFDSSIENFRYVSTKFLIAFCINTENEAMNSDTDLLCYGYVTFPMMVFNTILRKKL